ncbi:rhodanese-like domain-containing protein [bacterium]|nr:rhodanese-like domain-containing protein [bacterium]
MVRIIKDEQEFELKTENQGLILDLRDKADRALHQLKNAVPLDLYAQNFSEFVLSLDRKQPILIYSNDLSRSKGVIRLLSDSGFDQLYQLKKNAL